MKAILGMKDPELRAVYLTGAWTKLTGLIFPHFTIVDDLPTTYKKRYWGLDFGWKDETALVECRQIGRDIYIKEIIYQSELNYNDLAQTIHNLLNGIRGVADSASPRSINDLQRKGVRVSPSKKGRDSIIQGIQHVRTHNLFITRDSENLLKELRTYKFLKDKDGVETNTPVDYQNHGVDSMRYAITHFSKKSIINIV
jgi:phage terminase large subunit